MIRTYTYIYYKVGRKRLKRKPQLNSNIKINNIINKITAKEKNQNKDI